MNIIWKRSVLLAAISALSFTLGCPPPEVGDDAGNDPDPTPTVQPDGGEVVDPDGGVVITDPDGGVVITDPDGGVVNPPPRDGGTIPGPNNEPPTITTCDDTPAVTADPGADVCEVTVGTGGTLVVGDVLTPGEVFKGGQVLLDATGEIMCVGCGCAAQATTETVINCPDAVVSPGLVNAHDHAGWMSSQPFYDISANSDIPLDYRWEHRHDWRRGNGGQERVSSGQSGGGRDYGELRSILGGATSTFASGGAGGFLRNLDNSNNALGLPQSDYDTFPLGDQDGTTRTGNCNYGNIAGPNSADGFSKYVPHVAEGINGAARNEFLCLTGQIAGGEDTLNGNSSIIHGVGLIPADIALIGQRGIGVVWTPRSNISLYGDTAQVTQMHRRGVQIGLGTDWMPSGSMSMLRELNCIDEVNQANFSGYFSDESLWRMATLGSAATLGMDSRIGLLATGHVGDIAIFANNGREDYRAVLEANPGDVALVLISGKPMSGNAAVVEALETGCDIIGDVCGAEKRACTQREVGQSFTALEASAGAAYPLFQCETPRSEPTCVPARTLSGDVVDGSNLYEGVSRVDDRDGDGILDANDNCPDIFNPIRPLDNGNQGDADNDNIGDVCDPCPLTADSTDCVVYNPSDSDGDGIDNVDDNCPQMANEDQADGDSDNIGDVCDACPDFSNLNGVGCPADLEAIKTDAALQGQTISLVENMIVSAVTYNGLWIQKDEVPPTPFSGIFVYVGGVPTQTQGAVVKVTGATVSEFFGQLQLTDATLVDQGTTAEVTPYVMTAMEQTQAVTDEGASGFEGMLVKLEGAEVSDNMPPAAFGDSINEFEVTGGLRVDDSAYPEGSVFLDPFPENGFVFTSITGVLSFRSAAMKVLPRDDTDFALGTPSLRHFAPIDSTHYIRVGQDGATFDGTVDVNPLKLVLTSDAEEEMTIEVVSNDASVTVTGSPFTIAIGERELQIPVQGVSAGTATLTANILGDVDTISATVVVLENANAVEVASLTPADLSVLIDDVETFTVTLDAPAPVGGIDVTLTADAAIGSVPATVNVAENRLVASFDLTAPAVAGSGSLTAEINTQVSVTVTIIDAPDGSLVINEVDYDQPDQDAAEFIEIYNGGPSVELAGYQIVLVNGNQSALYATIDLTGTLASGAFAVVHAPGMSIEPGALSFDFASADNNVQNGSPDGVALLDNTGALVDAVAYEGALSADFGNGTESLVTGNAITAEDANSGTITLCRKADGVDSGDDDTDWGVCPTPTPGAANNF